MLDLNGRQLLMLAILSYSDCDPRRCAELEHPASAFGPAWRALCGALRREHYSSCSLTGRATVAGAESPIEWWCARLRATRVPYGCAIAAGRAGHDGDLK